MFKQRVKKPSTLLSRSSHQGDDNTDENESPRHSEDDTDSPSALAAKIKTKKKKEKAKLSSRLSFGSTAEDSVDEEETFKIKKSNLSLNMAARPTLPTESPSRPTYDSEYLGMLKANTPSRPGSYKGTTDVDVSMDSDYDADQSMQIEEIEIPAESSIKHAKERREKLRVSKPEDDYISLSLTTTADRDLGPHPESRLVREEDELGEGDDEYAEYTSAQERIALGTKGRKKEKMQRREEMRGLIEELDPDDVDPEEEGWESEVLRRAGSSSILGSKPPKPAPKPVYKPTPVPEPTEIPPASIALKSLSAALSNLRTSHTAHQKQLQQVAQEQEELQRREIELRELVIEAEEKRAWWKEFEVWIGGAGAFLDEKFPQLEALESRHLFLVHQRASLISKRRSSQDKHDVATVFGTVPVLNSEDAIGLSTSVNPTDEVDALDPSHTVHYLNALSSIEEEKRAILRDVNSEEFLTPFQFSANSSSAQSVGLVRWHEWRTKYTDSYVSAWGGLGAVSVWEFWLRLEICGWDPLQPPTRTLDSFDWFKAVHQYSATGEGDVDDTGTLPSLIGTALIPRLVKIITPSVEPEQGTGGMEDADAQRIPPGTSAFNPYSTAMTKRLVEFCEEIAVTMVVHTLESSFPQKGPNGSDNELKTQLLYGVVTSVFDAAVEDDRVLLARYVTTTRLNSSLERLTAVKRFCSRRIIFLQNIIRWRNFLKSTSSGPPAVDTTLRTFVREVLMKLLNNFGISDPITKANYIRDVENVLTPAGLAELMG